MGTAGAQAAAQLDPVQSRHINVQKEQIISVAFLHRLQQSTGISASPQRGLLSPPKRLLQLAAD